MSGRRSARLLAIAYRVSRIAYRHARCDRRYAICHTLLLCGLLFALAAGWVSPASAHGKEALITVASLTPDPTRPLVRLYRAEVKFDDGDPVEGAQIELTARRAEGGQTLGPVAFSALGEAGVYAAEVNYSRFGTWEVKVKVTEPGEGEATFTDSILPGQAQAVSDDPAAETSETLSVLFRFDGGDVLNIVFRFVHSLAGLAWFGLIGVVLVTRWFVAPEVRLAVLLRLRGLFSPVALASLAVLLASGVYNAVWNAPIRPPGAFNLPVMGTIPFGPAYLAALAGKILAYIVLVVIAVRLAGRLRRLSPDAPLADYGALARLAWAGVGTGIFLAIDVSILIYMHYISHLALFIPR